MRSHYDNIHISHICLFYFILFTDCCGWKIKLILELSSSYDSFNHARNVYLNHVYKSSNFICLFIYLFYPPHLLTKEIMKKLTNFLIKYVCVNQMK